MFTGIIESLGEVTGVEKQGTNIHFEIKSELAPELTVDQSISHNGVCLTVSRTSGEFYGVTAIDETLKKTTLGVLSAGSKVNLERCMPANGRFDGHIVQGHVDQSGQCTGITGQQGSWIFDFKYDPAKGNILVEKGSVCVNGVSLTCFNVRDGKFSVAIIPYTYEHTNFSLLKIGDKVNLEFDILGKYVQKIMQSRM